MGGVKPVPCNVRIIAATNRKLKSMVKAGVFREDLYYRLEQLVLEIPALRERPEDIILLAEIFVEKAAKEHGIELKGLIHSTKTALMRYTWPGNVRELENAIGCAVVYHKGKDAKRLSLKNFPSDLWKKLGVDIKTKDDRTKSRGKRAGREAVLKELRVGSPLTLADIVDRTNRPRTTIQRYVDALEKEGRVVVDRHFGPKGSVVKIASRGLVDPGQGDLF